MVFMVSSPDVGMLPFALGVAKKLARLEMTKAEIYQDLKEVQAEIRMLKLDGRCRKLEFPLQNYCHVHAEVKADDGYPYSDDSDYEGCRCPPSSVSSMCSES